MTEPTTEDIAIPGQGSAQTSPAPPVHGPWADYQAAAQRLDAVRRAASASAGEQAAALQAARQELAGVRARLAPQRARLVQEFGVPEQDLVPRGPEQVPAMGGGPAAVLAALRQVRGTADAADAAMLESPAKRLASLRPWARNLLIYGPFAAAVLIVQIVLYLVAPAGSVPTYALLCGLSMPLLAFGMGWVTIGFVYGGGPEKVDRTPLVGVVACLTPVLLTCMAVGLLQFLR